MDGDGKAFEPADAATSLQEREREELRRLAFGGAPTLFQCLCSSIQSLIAARRRA